MDAIERAKRSTRAHQGALARSKREAWKVQLESSRQVARKQQGFSSQAGQAVVGKVQGKRRAFSGRACFDSRSTDRFNVGIIVISKVGMADAKNHRKRQGQSRVTDRLTGAES
ncbi:hypothetical protein [Burkholderia sp. Ax-1719]|uniref:hypothetical protein n=1 Tax=Burkholderia sp. Ax-1719 TaxID=2608334 RepID=UPI0014249059|nr:hypothetical protein [Burkholderia sp. Ax-1719]NIE67033.1 hypothetical protein [Burkholderia sp. Ax-1719]